MGSALRPAVDLSNKKDGRETVVIDFLPTPAFRRRPVWCGPPVNKGAWPTRSAGSSS